MCVCVFACVLFACVYVCVRCECAFACACVCVCECVFVHLPPPLPLLRPPPPLSLPPPPPCLTARSTHHRSVLLNGVVRSLSISLSLCVCVCVCMFSLSLSLSVCVPVSPCIPSKKKQDNRDVDTPQTDTDGGVARVAATNPAVPKYKYLHVRMVCI